MNKLNAGGEIHVGLTVGKVDVSSIGASILHLKALIAASQNRSIVGLALNA